MILEEDFIIEEELNEEAISCDNADDNDEGCGVISEEEKNRLAEENVKVVYHVAKGFYNTGIDPDELISIAFLGYAKAIDSYKSNRNTKFSTYAINCIKNEILYMLKKEKKHRMHNISMNKVLSTDKNGNNLMLEEIILSMEDANLGGLEKSLLEAEKNDRIKYVIDNELTERERYVISHRYELYNAELKTQSQLAKELNMSQANISKIEKSVLKKMKKYIDKSELEV